MAEGGHVFDKASQFGQVLSNPWLCDESAGSTPDFDEPAIGKIWMALRTVVRLTAKR